MGERIGKGLAARDLRMVKVLSRMERIDKLLVEQRQITCKELLPMVKDCVKSIKALAITVKEEVCE